jgi:hypothetical protein
MSFARYDPATESAMDLANEKALFQTQKERENFLLNRESDAQKSQQDKKYQDELDSLTKSLSQQKALDLARKQKAEYDSGYVDPNQAALKAINQKAELDKAAEAGQTDFQKYSQKNDYDLNNQSRAWREANMYKMKEASQGSDLRVREADQSNVAQKDRLVTQLDTQKAMQQAGFNQTNTLRRDDNQRAIDGFKMRF